MMTPDMYVQPDAADPILDSGVVIDLARRHVPRASKVLEIDESGGEARVYLLDADLVVKVQRPQQLRQRTSLAKEALILDHLNRVASMAVPHLHGYGQEGSVEYIVMSRMPGIAMCRAKLTPDVRSTVLRDLGDALRRLHAVNYARTSVPEHISGDDNASDVEARLGGALRRLASDLDEVEGWSPPFPCAEMISRALHGLPRRLRLAVLHSNPGEEHTFVDSRSGRFIGLIDFADSFRSHPALDLRRWTDTADAQDIRAAYSASGRLPAGFDVVWRTGRVITAMDQAITGRLAPDVAARSIRRLLTESRVRRFR